MFVRVFRKKFGGLALLLDSMMFTTYVYAHENAARRLLAAANNDADNENGEKGVAGNLGKEASCG